MQRRLSAILAVDMVDYTRLMAESETKAIGLIRELKDSHLEPVVIDAGGEILKRMGDGWIIAFPSIQQLVGCAIEFQENLSAHPDITLRTAAHIGEIVEDENDFYGSGVNLTQRLQTEAPPGGMLISADLYRQLSGEESKLFEDAGSFLLKNIPLPVNAYQWRPGRNRKTGLQGELPSISIEPFEYAPENSETRSIVSDIRHQLLGVMSQRTGVRIKDGAGHPGDASLYVLRGRLRLAGSSGRLQLSMLMTDTGSVVWSRQYEANCEDVFRFSDDIVKLANADLRIQINAFDGNRLADLADEELSISELRARAAHLFHEGTVAGHTRAQMLMERALTLNPEDAMSLAMHTEAVLFLAAARHQTPDETALRSLESNINKAVETAPRSDYVRQVHALFSLWGTGNGQEARRDIDRCLAINANYPWGIYSSGLLHGTRGEFQAACAALERAIVLSEADPLLPHFLFTLALFRHCEGAYAQSLEQIDQAIHLRPGQWAFHVLKALNQDRTGDSEAARASFARAQSLTREPLILAPRIGLPDDFAGLVEQLAPDTA